MMFITVVECMRIDHTVFSCVPWIHIHFQYVSTQLIIYLVVKNLSLYLIHSLHEQPIANIPTGSEICAYRLTVEKELRK